MDPIEGTIEQILFYSPDTGYTVFKFLTSDGQSLTVIGSFPPLAPGEMLRIQGRWEVNQRYGKQYRMESFIPVLPSSARGIEKFLSSGLIHGVGPVLARNIVRRYGERTLDILSHNPDKLREIEGVGPVKLRAIKQAWHEHEDIRGLIIFLQDHGVSTSLATKIYKQYGDKAYHILKTNPYQACHDIWGIGFKTADQIAMKMGLSPTSPERIKAFLAYLMEKDTEQGHVFSLQNDLIKSCRKELDAEEQNVKEALTELERQALIVMEDADPQRAVYLPFFHKAQEDVARSLHTLVRVPVEAPQVEINTALRKAEKDLAIKFSKAQQRAVRECLSKKILVITGGPGTGKTTIIKAVVDIFQKWGQKVILTAPTGRAAKRLSEATRREARTIHRTLEFNPKLGNFRRDEHHPLTGEALIVDEFSMVDLPLMHHLLKAVPKTMRLILVGDKDQLPSVGPGNLLRDIIASGTVDVVVLDEIFRQAKDSLIVHNAHRVNQGKSLIYPPKGDRDADFYFIRQEDEQKVFRLILNLCSDNIPQKLGLDPLSSQIQVISPMYRGLLGVDSLNRELQRRLNPSPVGLKIGTRDFRTHDKVMQVKNNYEKEIFNGDIGTVMEIDQRAFRILVDYDGQPVMYEREEMNEITHAFAISVHKSQGGEYQAVVMPLMTQHYIMLQRNLFYTALTRARRLSCIIGSVQALHIAIKNNKPIHRNSRLREKLNSLSHNRSSPDRPGTDGGSVAGH